jgi:hypothetical protein
MERTPGDIVRASFLKGDVGINQIDYINSRQKVVDKMLGNPAGHRQGGSLIRKRGLDFGADD